MKVEEALRSIPPLSMLFLDFVVVGLVVAVAELGLNFQHDLLLLKMRMSKKDHVSAPGFVLVLSLHLVLSPFLLYSQRH